MRSTLQTKTTKTDRQNVVSGARPKVGLKQALSALLVVLVALLAGTGFIERLDKFLFEMRMTWSPVRASGQIAFVSIDAKSIEQIGSWPWSRSIHAELLDLLSEGGAASVFFDIDFAFASDEAGDAALSEALETASGDVYLPVFAQSGEFLGSDVQSYNFPHQPFRERAWLVAVNIEGGMDGRIWRYPIGSDIDGTFVESAAAVLSGYFSTASPSIGIDYSIDVASIPTVSAIDLLEGKIDPTAFRGLSVIIGASAIELQDIYAVPVHGYIPGAMIHALAAETLLNDRALQPLNPVLPPLIFALPLIFLNQSVRRSNHRVVPLLGLALVALEAFALIAFIAFGWLVPTASVHLLIWAFVIFQLGTWLNLAKLLLKRRDVEIENARSILSHLFNFGRDAVLILDKHGRLLLSNPAAESLFEGTGQGNLAVPPDLLRTALEEPNTTSARSLTLKLNGEGRTLDYSSAQFAVSQITLDGKSMTTQDVLAITARDVTAQREQAERIEYLSNYDDRTGALRRSTFLIELQTALDSSFAVGVFALNLNRFKTVNVTLGRDIGDAVLATVVRRLNSIQPLVGAVARLDGDGFCFLVKSSAENELADEVESRVQEVLQAPISVGDVKAQTGWRMGYEIVPAGSNQRASDVLQRAEEALDTATLANSVSAYAPMISEAKRRGRELESHLAKAIENDEFHLMYQPQVTLVDGSLKGAEALLRWTSPDLGKVRPDEFIGVAETSGMIEELGTLVLDKAICDAASLPAWFEMAINVSALQFSSGRLFETVEKALWKHKLCGKQLCLELTESAVLDDADSVLEVMREITALGPTWALDDFGTGYSSFGHLSGMPLSKIKLDRSFMENIATDRASLAIVRSVKNLCDSLEICLLCEGMETEEQVRVLIEEGCQLAQGYYFGRPQPIEAIRAVLPKSIPEKVHRKA